MASNVGATCQLCCGVFKVLCYQYCCCCFHEAKKRKLEINVLVLGLQNSGKSYLLATLCGEPVDEIASTNGFSIKDVNLPNSMIHMKEVGGSDKIRPYWFHYTDKAEGVIFVIDGSDLEIDKLKEIKSTLYEVMNNEHLMHKPLLILLTKMNPDHNLTLSLPDHLDLANLNCSFIVDYASDVPALKQTLQKYADNVSLQRYADDLTANHYTRI